MIISHKHEFILIKPRKVAGSSLVVALGKHCGNQDIVSKILGVDDHQRRNSSGLCEHMTPISIKEFVGDDIWSSYFKIVPIRNPWDAVVSFFYWNKRNEVLANNQIIDCKFMDEFKKFVLHGRKKPLANDLRFWTIDGLPFADFVIRFESLQDDFDLLCDTINLPPSILPKVKSAFRPDDVHYSFLYNCEEKLIAKIGTMFEDFNVMFGYRFEQCNMIPRMATKDVSEEFAKRFRERVSS
jgi:hypothetical protein